MLDINDSEVKVLKSSIKWEKKSREDLEDEMFTQMLSRLNEEERLTVLYYCIVNDTFNRIKKRKDYTIES